jgi:hypothetical protein
MKSPACPCAKKSKKKSKTKTQAKSKQAMKSKAEINKFSALRAPIMANTSGVFDRATLASSRGGTFSIPGFAPINAFPYPGISLGNTSQMYGLLTGSNLADIAAVNISRIQAKQNEISSGPGATGLNPQPKGTASGHSINMTDLSQPLISPTLPGKVKLEPSPDEILRAYQLGQESANFNAYNPGVGDSQTNPLTLIGTDAPRSNPSRGAKEIGTLTRKATNQK